jgi:hypothetical protein
MGVNFLPVALRSTGVIRLPDIVRAPRIVLGSSHRDIDTISSTIHLHFLPYQP